MAADKENTASGGTSAVKTSSTRPDRAGASDHSDATADQRTSQRDQRRKRAVMTSAAAVLRRAGWSDVCMMTYFPTVALEKESSNVR